MPAALVWLRNDLRTHDHPALRRALDWGAATGGQVIPVWCADPRLLTGRTPHGFPKTGAFRASFLLEALADLRARLRALGSDLVIRTGAPADALATLARETDAVLCVHHAEATDEELRDEAAARDALAPLGVRVVSEWAHTLLHPDDLPFPVARLPKHFTAFREAVERRAATVTARDFRDDVRPRAPIAAPDALPPLPPRLDTGALPTLDALGMRQPPRDPRATRTFAGGEGAGLARLARWIDELGALPRYRDTRNGLLGGDDASQLSAWLSNGCLSPRRVHAAVLAWEATHGRSEGSYWLVFELLWRDFHRFVAVQHGARLFRADGLHGRAHPFRTLDDPATRTEFERWRTGTTGERFVDAGMRELLATGFTSNRMRQNVASWLVQRRGIDWRAGAEWFESQLIDYDPTSNWGNWAYLAGVGADPRGDRQFDPARQAAQYDPDGQFVRHWLGAAASTGAAPAERGPS